MKSILGALCMIAAANQATALSCMRPDPVMTFKQVAAAPEPYFVLYGRLSFDEAALPAGVSDNPAPVPAAITATFSGMSLTTEGFVRPYETELNLVPTCAGPWCGSARSGIDAIYFVRADTDPVMVEAAPCGGFIFENPPAAVTDALTLCMQGGSCSPQPPQQGQ